MNDVKWIKIDTGIFDNRKVKQIRTLPDGDAMIVIWLQLLCLARTVNDYGRIYLTEEIAYTDQMLATAFNEPLPTVQMALDVFCKFGMIDVIDDIILIKNWEKYQSIEGLEKVREQTRLRVQKYREKQKQIECNVTVTSQLRDVTHQKENKKENKKENIRYMPTLEEIEAYCKQRKNSVDAKRFFDYYTENDWKDSKGNKVVNWKQKVITWERMENKKMPDFEMKYNKAKQDFDEIKKQLYGEK